MLTTEDLAKWVNIVNMPSFGWLTAWNWWSTIMSELVKLQIIRERKERTHAKLTVGKNKNGNKPMLLDDIRYIHTQQIIFALNSLHMPHDTTSLMLWVTMILVGWSSNPSNTLPPSVYISYVAHRTNQSLPDWILIDARKASCLNYKSSRSLCWY